VTFGPGVCAPGALPTEVAVATGVAGECCALSDISEAMVLPFKTLVRVEHLKHRPELFNL
jgi:hypothetical protein